MKGERTMCYTEFKKAKEEVRSRFANQELKTKVEEYLGDLPASLREASSPRAIIARQVATPNYEGIRFWDLTSGNGIKPLWFEYSQDMFCTNNPDKLRLGKMIFFEGRGRNGGAKTKTHKIIDFDRASTQRICEVELKSGKGSLLDIHRRMFNTQFSELAEVVDMSGWLKKMGGRSELYYRSFLSLFVCHGILFESYLTDGSEGRFSKRVVFPAMEFVKEKFGFEPLIVRLLPEEEEHDTSWCWYPQSLQTCLKAL